MSRSRRHTPDHVRPSGAGTASAGAGGCRLPAHLVLSLALSLLLPVAAWSQANEEPPVAGDEPDAVAEERTFSLRLDPLFSPRWDAVQELRMAAWDAPMSRLELGLARELRAARDHGPTGPAIPPAHMMLPLRMSFGSEAHGRLVVRGPWSEHWQDLTWQEKVMVTTETAVMLAIFAKALESVL